MEATGLKVNRGAWYGLEVPCIYRLYSPKGLASIKTMYHSHILPAHVHMHGWLQGPSTLLTIMLPLLLHIDKYIIYWGSFWWPKSDTNQQHTNENACRIKTLYYRTLVLTSVLRLPEESPVCVTTLGSLHSVCPLLLSLSSATCTSTVVSSPPVVNWESSTDVSCSCEGRLLPSCCLVDLHICKNNTHIANDNT